jgi:Flp pilus assembly protein TadG
MMKPLTKSNHERGNAMIEFALSSLVLVTMFIATFQFGYAFYVYNRLQTAVRNGARYASVRTFRAADNTSITKFKTAVQQMVVYGNSAAVSGTPVVPGLAAESVTVNITDAAGNAAGTAVMPDKVQVYVSNYSLDALFRTYSFTSKPYENFPYVGVWLPTFPEP